MALIRVTIHTVLQVNWERCAKHVARMDNQELQFSDRNPTEKRLLKHQDTDGENTTGNGTKNVWCSKLK
jgi:hypothetical protein